MMDSIKIPEIKLPDHYMMPVIAMGTAADPLPPPDELVSIFLDAIAIGYRHFDTAAVYGTEEPLGRAVAEALERGLIKNREELFITSKLWCAGNEIDLVIPALRETLRKLNLSYVDLYLIHWPVRLKEGVNSLKFAKEDVIPFNMHATWKAMEKCCEIGLTKSIGVSNFSRKRLGFLVTEGTLPPNVNQVEMNVAWQQENMLNFCRQQRIHVSAWSPLGSNGASWGSRRVMESPVLHKIAADKGKTVPQVALRWIYQQGASIVVKSFNKERMKENLQIFDWELTQEEMEQIKQIPQSRGFTGECFVHEKGPYKSVEHLWDGELI